MKPPIKTIPRLLLTAFALWLFILCSISRAVPPPDGCYPGFTTAEGCQALRNLSSGAANTGVGWFSLWSDTTGSFNTGLGAAALALNNADNNTALGAGALVLNNTGSENTGSGAFALFNNSTGNHNTANGYYALFNNTTSSDNSAFGWGALSSNTFGQINTASGYLALHNNTDGPGNTAAGAYALAQNTTGESNTATGVAALFINSTGAWNTAVGWNALNISNGSRNTATGYKALINNTTGDDNTAVGYLALAFSGTGSGNIALGANSGGSVTTADNVICIGSNVAGANVNNSCFIGNIFGVTTGMDAAPVVVDATGQLGTIVSSRRFKRDIEPMDKASEAILSLKPVTFHYKSDKKNIAQFGLIAEDVANVNRDLVVRDRSGEVYTVRYDAVNAMLLNEFLKEHKKVDEQQATITELKSMVAQQQKSFQSKLTEEEKEIAELACDLRKVSAHLELNQPSTTTVASNQ